MHMIKKNLLMQKQYTTKKKTKKQIDMQLSLHSD
jgi:hypothetical protein